jgi:hypothetical protein
MYRNHQHVISTTKTNIITWQHFCSVSFVSFCFLLFLSAHLAMFNCRIPFVSTRPTFAHHWQ